MGDLRNSVPGHDQYELLVAHGLGESFGGLWVERDHGVTRFWARRWWR